MLKLDLACKLSFLLREMVKGKKWSIISGKITQTYLTLITLKKPMKSSTNLLKQQKAKSKTGLREVLDGLLKEFLNAYINVARFQPLRGGTYLPLPPNLAKKRAIINVKNNDNQCLKCSLRAALFPPADGKDPQRQSKYPVDDGINYEGISFSTPLKQIKTLEKNNPKLAINVFAWERGEVIVHRISEKDRSVERVNLILIHRGEIQHYCYVKRVSALLYDKKMNRKTFHCMLCLTRFKAAQVYTNHMKHCEGINGKPARIEMPKEGENILKFQNFHKQMRVPYVIYADFESLIRKMPGCGFFSALRRLF